MVDRTQGVGVLGARRQSGDDVVALPGLGGADDGHAGRIDALADLNMVEVRFHRRATACLAIPVDGHHAKLGRQYRLRRYGAWRHVRFDGGHDSFRPFAELVRIRRHGPDAHLDLRAAIQSAETKLRLISRAGRMPRRTIHVPAPLNGVIADLDGGVIRGLCDSAPRCCGQTVGVPVRPDICVCLHHKPKRSLRHAMVTVRGGRAALATGQRGTTGDALDLLRLTHRSVILDVIQRD